ncbi:MAG: hypothetical protein MJ172_06185 [Clostridia bacterium]|nr:hypothetical protein [Clostridia bacterium]
MNIKMRPIYIVLFVFCGIYVAILLSCLFYPGNHLYILQGLKYNDGEINLFDLSRWLILLASPLIGNAIILDTLDKIEILTLIRIKKRKYLERNEILCCSINVSVWLVLISIFYAVFVQKNFVLWVLVFISHNMMLMIVTITIYRMMNKATWTLLAPTILFTFIFMIGEKTKLFAQCNPLCWGMYVRGDVVLKIILNIVVAVLTITIRRISYGKNNNR